MAARVHDVDGLGDEANAAIVGAGDGATKQSRETLIGRDRHWFCRRRNERATTERHGAEHEP